MNTKKFFGMLIAITTACALTVGCSDSDDNSDSGADSGADSGSGGTNAGGSGGTNAGGSGGTSAGGSEAGGAGGGNAGGTGGSAAGGTGGDTENPDTKCAAWCAKVMALDTCKPADNNDKCRAMCKEKLTEDPCRASWNNLILCEAATELKCKIVHPESIDPACVEKRRAYVTCSTPVPVD